MKQIKYILCTLVLAQAASVEAVTPFPVVYEYPVQGNFLEFTYDGSGKPCNSPYQSLLGYGGTSETTITGHLVNGIPDGAQCNSPANSFPQQIQWALTPTGYCLVYGEPNSASPSLNPTVSVNPINIIWTTTSGGTFNTNLTTQLCQSAVYKGVNVKLQGCKIDPNTPGWLDCCYSDGSYADCNF